MRKVTYPTRVALSEIPDEGRQMTFDSEGAELTPQLQDLIKNSPYNVEISLRPMGNVYEITGKVASHMDIPCSRCGTDVATPVNVNFNELIVIEKARPRKSSTTHVSNTEEGEGPFCNYVQSDMFDLGEFIHEQLASNEPYQVRCGQDSCVDIVNLLQQNEAAAFVEPEKDSPFAVLKNLKLNS